MSRKSKFVLKNNKVPIHFSNLAGCFSQLLSNQRAKKSIRNAQMSPVQKKFSGRTEYSKIFKILQSLGTSFQILAIATAFSSFVR